MYFLYLYATTASSSDTSNESTFEKVESFEDFDEQELDGLGELEQSHTFTSHDSPPRLFLDIKSPTFDISDPLGAPLLSYDYASGISFGTASFNQSPTRGASLYTPEFERSLSTVVDHDEVLAQKSIEPMLNMQSPEIEWGALYELQKFKNGSFSDWVYAVLSHETNQLLYVIKSLKNHPISRARRASIEGQLRLLSNELVSEIRRKAQLSAPEKVFDHFEKLQKEAVPIFEKQNLFHVCLPVQLLRVPDEEGAIRYIEIAEAAQNESLEDYVKNQSKDDFRKVMHVLKILGKRLALFHGNTGYIHGDLNLGNVFIMENEHNNIDLSFIDAHTMTNVDAFLEERSIREHKEELRQSLFLEDVRNFVEVMSRLSIAKIISEALVHTYMDSFLAGYKEGYAEVFLSPKFEVIKNEIFHPAENIEEEI